LSLITHRYPRSRLLTLHPSFILQTTRRELSAMT
jgi:hypothetical protein